ncbi:MAG: hypothetical protein AAFZ15_30240 [Bacteroidota bacterium]
MRITVALILAFIFFITNNLKSHSSAHLSKVEKIGVFILQIDSLKLENVLLPTYSVDLKINQSKPKTSFGAFMKTFTITVGASVATGGVFGFTQGPNEDLDKKDFALIWGSLFGIVGVFVGATLGVERLLHFNRRKKQRYKILID